MIRFIRNDLVATERLDARDLPPPLDRSGESLGNPGALVERQLLQPLQGIARQGASEYAIGDTVGVFLEEEVTVTVAVQDGNERVGRISGPPAADASG